MKIFAKDLFMATMKDGLCIIYTLQSKAPITNNG